MLKTLNWYVAKSFLFTFFAAIGVLTFGMTGARLIRVLDLISNGVSPQKAFVFILYMMPIVLAFTIPWAALVSIMLVFGKLSADNEITAMRACGISILQIVSPIIAIVFGMTCLCLYLQMEAGPRYLGKSQMVIKSLIVDNPLSLFEPGVMVEFNDCRLQIDYKNNDTGEIRWIRLIRQDKGRCQDVSASSGKLLVDKEAQILHIVLENASILEYENGNTLDTRRSFVRALSVDFNYGKEFNSRDITLRDKHEGYQELYARSVIYREAGDRTRLCEIETELNQRIALALAPMAFLLLGLPLAIRTSRRETSIGLFLSVLLAGAYFGFVLISDTLQSTTWAYPQYIVWIPPALFQIFGAIYIFKIARN